MRPTIKAILGAREANIQKGITYDLEEVLRNDSQLFFLILLLLLLLSRQILGDF